MPDERILACSDAKGHNGKIFETLLELEMIDSHTAELAGTVFEKGGEGAYVCGDGNKTDSICVRYLSGNNCVLVQTFPKKITENMVKMENLIGIQLETVLIILFIIYIILMLIHAGRERKSLEKENREMGYIISGVNTLFTRFAMVDLEMGTYLYLAGTRPENSGLAVSGSYQDLTRYLCGVLVEENEREDFAGFLDRQSIIEAMKVHNDLRYECHVKRIGGAEWKQVNII